MSPSTTHPGPAAFSTQAPVGAQDQAEPKASQRWWIRQQVRWYNLIGQPLQTIAVQQSAVNRWPLWGDGIEGLAFAMAQTDRADAAVDLLQTLLQREPTRAQAWFNMGFLLQDLEAKTGRNPARVTAEHALRQATQLAPGNDRAWYGLALELIAQGRQQEAVPCLKTCTKLQPMSPYAWYQLGRTHAALGQADEANAVLAQLRTFDPKVSNQLQRELAALSTPV
jgi:predicted Zn-dependent protease